jgi:hypothetical protein
VLGENLRFRSGPRRRRWPALTVVVATGVTGGVVLADGPAGRTTEERAAGTTRPRGPVPTVEEIASPPPGEALASPPSPPPTADPVASVAPTSPVTSRESASVRRPPAPAAETRRDGDRWIASTEPLAASPPVRVDIPGVGATAPTDPLGLNPDGTLEVPDQFSRAGWYTGRPTPGETGPAIIVAHRASRRGPGAFWHLPEVQPGEEILVTRADGRRIVFVVDRLEQHPKDAFPTEAVYGPTSEAALRLITCGGPFEPTLGDHYRDNVIVFARMAGWVS